MRTFVHKIIYLVIPILFLIASINFIVDPANIFHKSVVDRAVNILIEGHNVEGLFDYDERELQIKYISAYKKSPDVIALGSSRVLQISQDMVKGSFLNNGVSGAGVYDYIGIAGIYKSCDIVPGKIIIGLDPWILNKKNGDTRYKTLNQYIQFFQGEETEPASYRNGGRFQNILQLFSPSYFQTSVCVRKGKEQINATNEKRGERIIKCTDGSVEYSRQTREMSREEVNAAALDYISGKIYQIEDYNSLDDDLKAEFEDLVSYFVNEGIEVIFYLPPYHPIVYKYINKHEKYREVLLAEKYFKDFAIDNSIELYGSYDPACCDCNEEDFFDGMHLKRSGLNKIFPNDL